MTVFGKSHQTLILGIWSSSTDLVALTKLDHVGSWAHDVLLSLLGSGRLDTTLYLNRHDPVSCRAQQTSASLTTRF